MTNIFTAKNVKVTQLIQYNDFTEEWYYDQAYENVLLMPHILFKLNNDKKISDITIAFKSFCEDIADIVDYRPIDLFQNKFWEKIIKTRDDDYSISFLTDIFLGGILFNEKDSKKIFLNDEKLSKLKYKIPFPVDCFDNIWNEYCIHTGTTSITRDEFCLWICRLYCLVYDLIEKPLILDGNWKQRYLLLVDFVQRKYSDKYEYFVSKGWSKPRKKVFLEKEDAFKLRLEDAKMLLSDFYNSVSMNSPLEAFLKKYYDDFGQLLTEKKYLLKCDFCNAYIDYVKGKKYCSLKSESRDCGKKARFQRYYNKHKKELRKKSKQSMKETREFLREKGIKK